MYTALFLEKVDRHPLFWPVFTQFQKLKRAQIDDEDDKLFAAAEKRVKPLLKEERKAKNDEAKFKAQTAGRQRINSRIDHRNHKADSVKCAEKHVLS